MILNNFIKYLYGCCPYDSARGGVPMPCINITGDSVSTQWDVNNTLFRRFVYSAKNYEYDGDFYIGVGTDDTPVTQDDCLWSHEINTLDNGGGSFTYVNGKIRILRTFTNNTDSDIVVKEVGLIIRMAGKSILIDREVLKQPYIVMPGGAQAFGVDIGIGRK